MAGTDVATPTSSARQHRSRAGLARALARARVGRAMLLARGREHRYGTEPSQTAELHLPEGAGPHPLVVLIHGGSWQKRYGKSVTRALASDLRRRGIAAWNIEYRRVGEGGGWPSTFADVGAAIDHLAMLDAPLDLDRVGVAGHSAGGHLALWAAARSRLAPGAPGAPAPPGSSAAGQRRQDEREVRLTHAVALAGVCDLQGAYRRWRGGAAKALMGGSPQQFPERFAIADPVALLPLQIAVLLVHGVEDTTVSIELSRSYAGAATAAGAAVELVELEGAGGHHRAHIDPRSRAWSTAARWLEDAARAEHAPRERAA